MQCVGHVGAPNLFLQKSGHKLGVKVANTCASKQELLFPLLNILYHPEMLSLVNEGM